MTILDQIEQFWNGFLQFLATLVIPDWTALIALLPVLLLIGLVGPLLSLAALAWLGYGVTKPRTTVRYDYGTRLAQLDAGGEPVYPPGEPFCPRDRLVYPSGTTRCDTCREGLSVACPKCSLVRNSAIDTCGNCGLILRVEPRAMIVVTDGPPPGGAAAA